MGALLPQLALLGDGASAVVGVGVAAPHAAVPELGGALRESAGVSGERFPGLHGLVVTDSVGEPAQPGAVSSAVEDYELALNVDPEVLTDVNPAKLVDYAPIAGRHGWDPSRLVSTSSSLANMHP